jgi:hypothetical protein
MVWALATESLASGVGIHTESDWRELGRQRRSRYLDAYPFPHLVERDLFPSDLILEAERQELPGALALPTHGTHRLRKAESATVNGPAAEALLSTMKSPPFMAFVEEVTGVRGLEPDDTNLWAGLHANVRGSFAAIHRDFILHAKTRKWHRVNALLFLNSDWRPEYRGDLELWTADSSECGARVKPDAGTLVIFETHSGTLHGIPDPIVCPENRARLSLAAYYYHSDEPPPGPLEEERFRRARRPQDPWWVGIPELPELARGVARPLGARFPALKRFVFDRRARRL